MRFFFFFLALPDRRRFKPVRQRVPISITLTPGTVSVDMVDDHILVHALVKEMSDPEDFKTMGEMSAWAAGEAKAAG